MTSIATALRRTALILAAAASVGALLSWRRGNSATPSPSAPPQWPPLSTRSAPASLLARPSRAAHTWLPALDDGSVPAGHPIKANDSSKIFHVPGGRFYDRTKPERCYATAAEAESDGYRQSKS